MSVHLKLSNIGFCSLNRRWEPSLLSLYMVYSPQTWLCPSMTNICDNRCSFFFLEFFWSSLTITSFFNEWYSKVISSVHKMLCQIDSGLSMYLLGILIFLFGSLVPSFLPTYVLMLISYKRRRTLLSLKWLSECDSRSGFGCQTWIRFKFADNLLIFCCRYFTLFSCSA